MSKHTRLGHWLWVLGALPIAALSACHRDPAPVAPVATGTTPEGAEPLDPSGRLPDHVRPSAYNLELEIAPASPDFSGHARIEVELTRPVESILLHAKGLQLTGVVVALPGAAGTTSATARPLSENGLVSLDLAQPV